ncbi:MAG: class I SAM-dependent methyltransferase [Bacteroidota bacterium]
MFTKSAEFYDLIYSGKDYQGESVALIEQIKRRKPNATRILDICCGTAEHRKYLNKVFQIDGLDLNEDFINQAKKKNPNGTFYVADMSDFELHKQYDVLICLFSSIGYVKTFDQLIATLKCFHKHLKDGGLMIVEPWLTPENWYHGKVHMLTREEDDFKICRMNRSDTKGNLSILHFHYLVGSSENGVVHFEEKHELALFTEDEMKRAFNEGSFEVTFDKEGITGRGLYYGVKKNIA